MIITWAYYNLEKIDFKNINYKMHSYDYKTISFIVNKLIMDLDIMIDADWYLSPLVQKVNNIISDSNIEIDFTNYEKSLQSLVDYTIKKMQ
jgi:hypothetical protein